MSRFLLTSLISDYPVMDRPTPRSDAPRLSATFKRKRLTGAVSVCRIQTRVQLYDVYSLSCELCAYVPCAETSGEAIECWQATRNSYCI